MLPTLSVHLVTGLLLSPRHSLSHCPCHGPAGACVGIRYLSFAAFILFLNKLESVSLHWHFPARISQTMGSSAQCLVARTLKRRTERQSKCLNGQSGLSADWQLSELSLDSPAGRSCAVRAVHTSQLGGALTEEGRDRLPKGNEATRGQEAQRGNRYMGWQTQTVKRTTKQSKARDTKAATHDPPPRAATQPKR